MNLNNSKRIISPLLLLLAALIWGFAFSAQKEASSTPPLILGSMRSLLAALFLGAIIFTVDSVKKKKAKGSPLKPKRKFSKEELISGGICGIVLALTNLFQQLGLMGGTSASKASFIIALYILLVPLYELFLGKIPNLKAIISIIISVPGFYLLCSVESFAVSLSDLFIIGSTLVFPIYILTIDKYSDRINPFKMSFIQFAVSAAASLIPAVIFELPADVNIIYSDLPYIILLGIGSSGIAYTLQVIGQKGVNPTVSALILSLESVFGAIGAALFLNENMKSNEIFGAVLIFIAVILSQIEFTRKEKNESNQKAKNTK